MLNAEKFVRGEKKGCNKIIYSLNQKKCTGNLFMNYQYTLKSIYFYYPQIDANLFNMVQNISKQYLRKKNQKLF